MGLEFSTFGVNAYLVRKCSGCFFWLYQGRLHGFAVGLVKAPPHQLVVGFFPYCLELMAMTQGIPEPVVVTGASGQVGRALISQLQRAGIRSKALVRKPAGLGDCLEYCDWMSSSEAESVLASAGAVVHLAGNLKPAKGDYTSANLKTTQRVANSISPTCCRRLIFLSFHGASTSSKNEYLASKAQAEEILLTAGVPTTILRCCHIVGSPTHPGPTASSLIAGSSGVVNLLGSGSQRWAPLALKDVVAAIISSLLGEHDGRFDLQGPEVMELDELVTVLNPGKRLRRVHIPAPFAHLLRFTGLPEALIEVMLSDCFSDPGGPATKALSILGINPTSLRQQWT